MKKVDALDVVIEKLTADHELLIEKNNLLDTTKIEKNEVLVRIKEYGKDLAVFIKYANDEQKKKIEALNLDVPSSSVRGLNPFSQIVVDTLAGAKGNSMKNGELYSAYVDSLDNGKDAEDYTQFNIKIRQLFKSGRVSKKQIDPNKSSRDDVITLHGSADN